MPTKPTLALYESLQTAFDHFNGVLFASELPDCLITLRSSRRQRGYHHAERFVSPDGKVIHELALNPGFFTLQPLEVALSTLVHEMVHHWQESLGQSTPSNHHNQEWVRRMQSIGLEPTSTGLPGGKQTGRKVSHYIHPDGLFIKACQQLIATGFTLPWMDRYAPVEPEELTQIRAHLAELTPQPELGATPLSTLPVEVKTDLNKPPQPMVFKPPEKRLNDRIKHVCPQCKASAWSKAHTQLVCGACHEEMETA